MCVEVELVVCMEGICEGGLDICTMETVFRGVRARTKTFLY